MTDLTRALQEFAQTFDDLGLPYVVMGGIAVRFYAIPRPTHDVDFTLSIDRDRLPELYERLETLGYTVPEAYSKGWVDSVAGMPVVKARLYLEGRGVDIDVFLAESSFQKELLARRRLEEVEESKVWFVTPEDLILLKLLAHRPRDLGDIGDILFTQGQLDEAYMRKWARQLGILNQLEQVLSQPPAI